MRTRFALLMFFLFTCAYSQTWNKKLYHSPQPYYDQFSDITQGTDSSVMMVGKTAVNNYYRLLIHKLDKAGNSQWSKIDSMLLPGWPVICAAADGDFIIAINVSEPEIPSHIRIIKISNEGIVKWTKDLNEWNTSWVNKIIADEQNIFFTGAVTRKESWETDLLIASLSYQGDLNWSYAYDAEANETGVRLERLQGDKLILAGIERCDQSSCIDRWFMVVFDTTGTIKASQFVSTENYHWIGINGIIVTEDNRIILSGGYSARPLIMEIDESLNFLTSFRLTDSLHSGYVGGMHSAPNNSVLISGSWGSKRMLMKLNSNNTADWIRTYDCPSMTMSGGGPVFPMANKKIMQLTTVDYHYTALTFMNEDGTAPGSSDITLNKEPVTLQTYPTNFTRYTWGEISDRTTQLFGYTITEEPICCERAEITGPDTICAGESVTLNATGGTAIHWNTGNTTSSISFTAFCNNYYVADILTDCGTTRDTLYLEVKIPPPAPVTADTTICADAYTELKATGEGQINWYDAVSGSIIQTGPVLILPQGISEKQTFYCTASNEWCESEKQTATIDITNNCSADELSSSLKLKAFPNPFTSSSALQFTLKTDSQVSLEIYESSLSKKITETEIKIAGDYTIDVGKDLTPGIYFVILRTDDETRTITLVKTKD